ncbi:MAG: regulatory protein GemA [Rhodospirillales bacterium]
MTSPLRKSLIQKIHVAKGVLGWDEALYRAALVTQTGKNSSTKLSDAELQSFYGFMKKNGFKPKPSSKKREVHAKIVALWAALYDLGVVRNPSDDALNAFVKRLAGVERLPWLTTDKANPVIEALKSMAEREAAVAWGEHDNPRVCVLRAQWRRLGALGVLRINKLEALDRFLMWKATPCIKSHTQLTAEEFDTGQRRLGKWLRGELKKRSKASSARAERSAT